jgi:hypothetical protein
VPERKEGSHAKAKMQRFWEGEDGHFISSTGTQAGEEGDREHEFCMLRGSLNLTQPFLLRLCFLA